MITNPIMIYSGGKWKIADWIISHFPKHEIYVEPFGGAGSVLLKKPRSKMEVYNDLSGRVSNVFKVMRDYPDELIRKLKLTPYSRNELIEATERSIDFIEDARRTIVRAHMSRGRAMMNNKGLRYSKSSNRTPEKSWANWVLNADQFSKRLMGVLIENRDAFDLMTDLDTPDTLFYLDPPYLGNARLEKRGKIYEKEMIGIESHEKFLSFAKGLKGSVFISGYESDLYSSELKDWHCFKHLLLTTAHTVATELLWCSPGALDQMSLFCESKKNRGPKT